MTNQEKKKELRKYGQIERRLDELIAERQAWIDQATRITPSLSGMPRANGISDKIGDAVAQVDKIDSRIAEVMCSLSCELDRINHVIDSVPDLKLQTLLRYRYILCMKWEDISDKMHFDLKWLHVLHGRALEAITPF